MSKAEERARHYLLNEHKSPLNQVLHQADLKTELQYHTDIENACKYGYHQAEKDVLDAIEKELTRRMLEDYNEGAEEDEIAQGCMASLIMFVRQMKEE